MSSQNWQPDMQKVGTIIRLIEYIQSSDNDKQREAFEKFHELKKMEEFSAYCAAIFARTELSIAVRRQSGLLLKEALRHNFRKQNGFHAQSDNMISDSVLNVCKKCLIQCLCEPDEKSKFIRDTSAIAITTIVRELHNDSNMAFNRYSEFDEWPDLIQTLLHLLQKHSQNDKDPVIVQSLLNVIYLLCYDCGKIMGECRESEKLIQCLLGFAKSGNTKKIREYCLKSLYYLFHYQGQTLLSQIPSYIKLILNCMNDMNDINKNDIIIIKVLTDSVIVLMNEYWMQLSSNNNQQVIGHIFEFMLNGTMCNDQEVSCTAAEFWALYATDPSKDNSYLISFFPKLIPNLIKRCRYTQELLSLIDFDNDDQSKADLAEDVAPLFYKGRAEQNGQSHTSTEHKNSHNHPGDGQQYPAVMDPEESSWNIRKCCATQLEKLSFAGDATKKALLKIVLPIIKETLASHDYLSREAGLLVLGAITQKEYESVIPALPELIPFILKQAKRDQHILVQQIACWSLARFSNWYYNTVEGERFFEKVLMQFLESMKSNSKRVQRAACGAISTFITCTKEKIISKDIYITSMMNTCLEAFKHYHLKNFPQLIDVILCFTNVIAEFTAHSQQNGHSAASPNGNGQNGQNEQNLKQKPNSVLCDPKFQDALLPPIIQRWIALQGDTNIFPLFEAITTWTTYIGHTEHFQKTYLKQIFVNSLNITIELKNECRVYNEYLKQLHDSNNPPTNTNGDDTDKQQQGQPQDDNEPDKPNKEFWVCGLDLLAVLVEKCNPSVRHLIWKQQIDGGFGGFYYQKLLEMLYCSICETHFNVRRNGLALLGDLITLHSEEMKDHISKFLRIVIANLNWDWQTVCTNASWCVGQALAKYGPQQHVLMVVSNNNKQEETLMDEFTDEILAHLVEILKCQSSPPYIVTNIAITMARLVGAFPNNIITKWDQFAVEWIRSLAMFQEDQDKIEAFTILMAVVMKNPIAVVQSRNGCKTLFEAIASWQSPPNDLNDKFQKVLIGFKKAAPNWNNIMNGLNQNTRQILQQRYQM